MHSREDGLNMTTTLIREMLLGPLFLLDRIRGGLKQPEIITLNHNDYSLDIPKAESIKQDNSRRITERQIDDYLERNKRSNQAIINWAVGGVSSSPRIRMSTSFLGEEFHYDTQLSSSPPPPNNLEKYYNSTDWFETE